jgi:ABC-type Fe3+-hydroxamate transport system substrate-binding protein
VATSEALRDALGTVHVAEPCPRIVCLVPSLTELLCTLGLGGRVVGRTGFCIHPAREVRTIAKVGGTKDVNVEKVRRLAPSHLVVNIDENEKPTVEALAQFVPHVVVTHPQGPLDNPELYRFFADLFCVPEAGARLAAEFSHAWQTLLATPWPRRRVLYLIWKDPWMTVAPTTYIGNMLAAVGWEQVFTPGAMRYPQIELDDAARAADLVLLSSEPYPFGETERIELARRLGRPVLLVDGEMLSWYGSRAIAGLAYLRELALGCPA